MSSDSWVFVTIVLSLGGAGLVFLGIAFFMKHKYGYKGGTKSTGTLVGFRKLDNDHYFGALRFAFGIGKYEDFNYNVQNSKPIIRFSVKGRTVETHSEWSVADLGKDDIGKQLPIRYFSINKGKTYMVVLEGTQYEQFRNRRVKIMFWIFAGIAIFLFALTIDAIITFG